MKLSIKDYSDTAFSCALYPGHGAGNPIYPVLGLNGEAGEVAEKMKKIIRDKGGNIDDADREAIKKELGDVAWYLNACCIEFGLELEDVMATNISKLLGRKERGTLQGSGDDR